MSASVEPSEKFDIPASFVTARARLTPGELRYGHVNHWISSADAVESAVNCVVPADSKMDSIEEISLLLSDELDRLPDLMDQLVDRDDHVWMYLALSWMHENQEDFDDPFKTVDLLFADFGYSQDVGEFVTFMPPPSGAAPGYPGLRERWQNYLEQKRDEFLVARISGAHNGSR